MVKKKIALFHPWIKSRGGSEKCLLDILKSKKIDVDIYTWVYDKEKTFEEFKNYKINVIGPKFARKISRAYLLRGLFFLIAFFNKIPLNNYDKFLISTSGVGEFITFRNYLPNKTYAYVYTPLRAATKEIVEWDLNVRYRNFFKKTAYLFSVYFYRMLEKIAWKRIDFPIFISEISLERAKDRNLIRNKTSRIVYPPIEIEKLRKLKTKKGNYFLYVSRINPPKRQDLLIHAWKNLSKQHKNEKLIIAGSGENQKFLKHIKEISKELENVEIKTDLREKELFELYKNCKAIVFIPFLEDFGIVPFEAIALGKPLIAVDKGGYVKLIQDYPYYKINEKYSSDKMVVEIERVLNEFSKSNPKQKKLKNIGNNTSEFINKIEKILLE